VDFSEANRQLKKDLPNLTSLEVPHPARRCHSET
jgi:hypothetical protein